jgi:hypothetical protein
MENTPLILAQALKELKETVNSLRCVTRKPKQDIQGQHSPIANGRREVDG